jgi:hypothetical protein
MHIKFSVRKPVETLLIGLKIDKRITDAIQIDFKDLNNNWLQ